MGLILADTGKRLKAFREKLGWSQEDVATALNVNRSHIAHLETGRKPPTYAVLGFYRSKGMDINEFLEETWTN